MREIIGHKAGKVFLLILSVSIIVTLYIPRFFFEEILFFGFITVPFMAGVILLVVWLLSYLVYFFFFWSYRH